MSQVEAELFNLSIPVVASNRLTCTILCACRLSGCLITKDGCASLASALNSNPSQLKVLDLSYNHPDDAGVELQAGVKDQHWKLETLRVEPAGAKWLKPGLKKYFCELIVDTNTINKNLKLSTNNRKVTHVRNDLIYPHHDDRFLDWCQLLSKDVLRGYWEVEWTGEVDISVRYRGIGRKGERRNCRFGENPQSWSLDCSNARGYAVYHNQRKSPIHPVARIRHGGTTEYHLEPSLFTSHHNTTPTPESPSFNTAGVIADAPPHTPPPPPRLLPVVLSE
ncbi:stonustoxin subunit beta-like [Simochromis diagramma]|uniref:stonustoxin subunit beta-like n=1 Tax=Simochromis diagramma TaxID=43689 RepID=UPI001A7E9497|nr:stonustoxin subunit beta-like [Simochromis diagramma]